MKHKKIVEHYSDFKSLAEEIGNLRYDALTEFLKELKYKFNRDAEADLKRGRKKLANELMTISARLRNAERASEKAWEICEPYMMIGEYHAWIVDIDEEKKEVYIEMQKSDDKNGIRYNANIPISDFSEEDQKLIEVGKTLSWNQKLKSKEIKIYPTVPYTKEEIEEIEKEAERLFNDLKWL